MTKINYLLLCQDVLANEKEQIIRNPYMVLTPLNIPGNFSFTVAIGVFDLKANNQYILKLDIKEPDGTTKELMNVNFTAPQDETPNKNGVGIGNLNLAFPNFEFYKDGIYTFNLSISSEHILDSKSVDVLVRKKAVLN